MFANSKRTPFNGKVDEVYTLSDYKKEEENTHHTGGKKEGFL